MEGLIIGSTALKHWFPNDYPREPEDLDIVVDTLEGKKNVPGTEYLENPVILKYQKKGYIEPVLLLTLKMSHMFWDFRWKKHMWDIQFLLKKGFQYDETILNELIQYWKKLNLRFVEAIQK